MRRALNWGLGGCHKCQSGTQDAQRASNWGSGSAQGIEAEFGAKSVKEGWGALKLG